jgi:putative ABC transport system permease protein
MNWLQLTSAIELGLIYGLVAIAVYITFRVIDFPDLTVDGSFPLGAAVVVSLITGGVNQIIAILLATLSGGMAGFVTAFLHTRWNILGLLAGILTMTALYSVNLRIMGMPNISLQNQQSMFCEDNVLLISFLIVAFILLVMAAFFKTSLGLAIRATGINEKVSGAYGINTQQMKLLALSLSNAITALGGAIFALVQGFADIAMGAGTIVVGLASVIIGEAIFRKQSVILALCSCVIGSIIYRIAVAFALNSSMIGLQVTDLNLITASLVATTMILAQGKGRLA